MATFPSYARIIEPGYGEAPDYGVLRSPMDDGLAKQRPRRTLPVVGRDVQILVLDKHDKLEFDKWVKTEINGGTGWFDLVDPVDDVQKKARIVAGKYRWSTPGGVWIASCQLETLG